MATDDERGIAERRRLFERRVEEQDAQEPGYAEAWAEFRASVLCHGGTDVVPPLFPDSLLRPLIDHGSALPESVTSVLRLGQQSQCHTNAVALWRSGEAVAIGTGYALSDDQLWREHSWAWSADGTLIETTEPRRRYYGLLLEGPRAERFANWIAAGDTDHLAEVASVNPSVLRALAESGATWDDPSEDLLWELLGDVERGEETFFIVERLADTSGQTYIQVIKDDNDDWIVERREGGADQHYATTVPERRRAHEIIARWALAASVESPETWTRVTV